MECITITEQAGSLEEDLLVVADERDPLKIVLQDELKELLEKSLSNIWEMGEKQVCLVFGLKGETPHTYKEAGEILGLSRERVRLNVEAAFRWMKKRSPLKEYMEEFPNREEWFACYEEGLKNDVY